MEDHRITSPPRVLRICEVKQNAVVNSAWTPSKLKSQVQARFKTSQKQAKSKHLRWSTSVSVCFFAPLRRFPLLRNKLWGAAAGPPQAFSIRPLPGFSLGAVLELFRLTRLSQSVLVCLKTTEFSPRTLAHSAGPGGSCYPGHLGAVLGPETYVCNDDAALDLGFTVISKTLVLPRQN